MVLIFVILVLTLSNLDIQAVQLNGVHSAPPNRNHSDVAVMQQLLHQQLITSDSDPWAVL